MRKELLKKTGTANPEAHNEAHVNEDSDDLQRKGLLEMVYETKKPKLSSQNILLKKEIEKSKGLESFKSDNGPEDGKTGLKSLSAPDIQKTAMFAISSPGTFIW